MGQLFATPSLSQNQQRDKLALRQPSSSWFMDWSLRFVTGSDFAARKANIRGSGSSLESAPVRVGGELHHVSDEFFTGVL